jgi:hypothetical protein
MANSKIMLSALQMGMPHLNDLARERGNLILCDFL